MRNKNNIIATLLSGLILVLIVIGVVGYISIYTNNFTTDLKTFHLKIDGEKIINDIDNFEIELNKEYKFEVIDNFYIHTPLECTIVPNLDIDATKFEFYVDNIYHQFCYEESLIKGFEIKVFQNYFILKASKDLTDILQLNYPNKNIQGCPNASNSGVNYFRLKVYSSDLSQTININFHLVRDFYLTLNPIAEDSEVISFSKDVLILTNKIRSLSFNYVIKDGYELAEIMYISDDLYLVDYDNGVCSVSLIDNVILSQDYQYYLNFTLC